MEEFCFALVDDLVQVGACIVRLIDAGVDPRDVYHLPTYWVY